MTRASDWLNQISHAARPIRSTTQIWEKTRYQYGISALDSQTSFGGETSGSVDKCRLFYQATYERTKWTLKFRFTFLFIESLQEIRNLLGGKMWRSEVSLGSFLEIPPIANIAGFATGFKLSDWLYSLSNEINVGMLYVLIHHLTTT